MLEREYYRDRELRQVRNVVIPAWYNRQGYANAMARLIAESCDKFEDPQAPHIFFSAHGLPLKYIEDLGDPYKTQTEASCKARAQRGGEGTARKGKRKDKWEFGYAWYGRGIDGKGVNREKAKHRRGRT